MVPVKTSPAVALKGCTKKVPHTLCVGGIVRGAEKIGRVWGWVVVRVCVLTATVARVVVVVFS